MPSYGAALNRRRLHSPRECSENRSRAAAERGELLGRRSPAGLLENSFRDTSFDLPPSEEPPVTARPSKLGSTPARQIPPVIDCWRPRHGMGVRFRAGLRGFGGVVP
jgi:hypothetical protein